jgi:hypothetical protein
MQHAPVGAHCVFLQKFIDKFKADVEMRNFIKHLKPH